MKRAIASLIMVPLFTFFIDFGGLLEDMHEWRDLIFASVPTAGEIIDAAQAPEEL